MLLVCTQTGWEMNWTVQTGKFWEPYDVAPLLDGARDLGFEFGTHFQTCSYDSLYDTEPTHLCIAHRKLLPVIVRNRSRGKPHGIPECEHGRWVPAGVDYVRREIRYRCPVWRDQEERCEPWNARIPESLDSPLVPFGSPKRKRLLRQRNRIESENGHLKSQYQLRQVIARGLRRVGVYVDMAIMTRLALALVLTQNEKARAGPAQE
jgi:hypothetical protein